MNNLDTLIKEKFNLFAGLRSEDEDQKMLEQLQDLCFGEVLMFISQNLTDEQKVSFEKEFEAADSDESKTAVFTNYLTLVPNAQSELNSRITAFLDKVKENSLNTPK